VDRGCRGVRDMTDFEFIFALFGLLIGLSLTEVLAGLARAIDARIRPDSNARIGWLTPMLGTFVILDLLSFWHAAWISRSLIVVSGESLMAVTAFAGAYYLAASLVFPRAITTDTDLDEHFFRVRRIIIGVLMALLLCQLGYYLTIPELATRVARPLSVALTVVLVALMAAAMLVRGERWARVAMGALIARYVIIYLL